jgi:hypothetical protein
MSGTNARKQKRTRGTDLFVYYPAHSRYYNIYRFNVEPGAVNKACRSQEFSPQPPGARRRAGTTAVLEQQRMFQVIAAEVQLRCQYAS